MNINSGQSKGGTRKRSVSESDTDRISSAVSSLKNKSQPQPNPTLVTDLSFDQYRSNPNISPPGSGYIETPLGLGRSTRLQSRLSFNAVERRERAEKECRNVKIDADQWIILMNTSPPPELNIFMDGYERFKRRIQRASEEAIIRRVSSKLSYQLADLLVKLNLLKKKAERRDRQDLQNPQKTAIEAPLTDGSISSDSDFEVNVFDDDNSEENYPLQRDEVLPLSLIHI